MRETSLVFPLPFSGERNFHFIPSMRPIFLCRPERVVGMPVIFAICRFAFVTPKARFQLKDSPGMPVLERLDNLIPPKNRALK